jgi:thioredoxin 1
MAVIELQDMKHFEKLSAMFQIIVIDFYADWCHPCKWVSPKFKELSKKYSDYNNIIFAKCNIENFKESSTIFSITALPTFLFFVNKDLVATVHGADINEVEENVVKVLKPDHSV